MAAPFNPFITNTQPSNSPFAGLQNAPDTTQPSTNTSQFGKANTVLNRTSSGGLGHVPLVNATTLSQYQERYDQLKVDRAKQRQKAIRDGQMADPNQPTSLNKAITPVGTCTSMCPEFERVERIVQKMYDKCERYLHPSSGTLQTMETKMLKRFRRSAAGYDEQLPSDIRTPNTLLQCTNYLIRHIIGGTEPLGIIHKFVWDRTRSIRNDFSVQQVTQETDVKTAVICLERIARFHIVSLHLLSSPENEEPFDRHQEREQLNNTMLSLIYYYDDHRGRIHFPNEDEFRAYYIIFSIHDQRPDLEARVSKWPTNLLKSPRVQVAMELYSASGNTWEYQKALDSRRPNAVAQGFYTRFFNTVNSPSVSYLMACVAEIYFSQVRQTAIRAIWKAYSRPQQSKNDDWKLDELTQVLHFDDEDETIKFCEDQGLEISENANQELYLNWGNRAIDSIEFSPSSDHAYSESNVESKRGGRNLVAVILGMNIKEAATMGLIDRSQLPERMEFSLGVPGIPESSVPIGSDEDMNPAPVVEPSAVLDSDRLTDESSSGTPAHFPSPLSGANQPLGFQPTVPVPQTSNPFKSPLNPFASPFATSTGVASSTIASSSAFNPFAAALNSAPSPSTVPAAPPSPFSFSKPAEEQKPSIGQEPSIFAGNSALKPSPEPSITAPNPFAASLSSFTVSQSPDSAPQASFPSPFTQQQPTPLLSTAKSSFPSTDFKNSNPAEVPTSQSKSSFSAPNPFFPSASIRDVGNANGPTPASTSPFNFANPAQQSPQPSKLPSFVPDPQPQKSLFPPVPLSDPEDKPKSIFANTNGSAKAGNFFSNVPSSENHTFGQEQTPVAMSQGDRHNQATENSSSASSLFAPASKLTSQPFNSIFSSPKSSEPMGQEPPASENPLFTRSQNPPSIFAPNASANDLPVKDNIQQPKLAPLTAATEQTPPESEKSDTLLASSLSPPEPSIKRKFEDGPPVQGTSEDEKVAWRALLMRISEKQARKKARKLEEEQRLERELEQEESRKRALEEEAADELSDGRESKTLKVSDLVGNAEPEKNFSLHEAETRPLPRLPCLDHFDASFNNRESTAAEIEAIEAAGRARRQRAFDEDEILLSAARIAAEQLKNGPKIFDPHPSEYTAGHSLSHHPYRSFSDPNSLSQSMSMPPPRPTHGYKVAYAPDKPVGLGRTMSRSEERIRRTGAHGLAYIPLDFSRRKSVDKNKSLDERVNFSRTT
ncbi:hypothetical protein N7454_002213 [Penicillium verhagenii]|nr:hypothetical protein N7454_002213 [Penicillium verhagenii]